MCMVHGQGYAKKLSHGSAKSAAAVGLRAGSDTKQHSIMFLQCSHPSFDQPAG